MQQITKKNGDIIPFVREKDYIMINNNLGGGSFGKTVLLKDTTIDELFAAKKYEPEFSELKAQFYDAFRQEIKILYKLNHKNIVRIYNYYLYDEIKTGYILMEYIKGKRIDEVFQTEPMDFRDDIIYDLDDVFSQLIDAFCYLESKKIMHRDIREGNILIDENGDPKVIDFGLGKMFLPVDKSSTDSKTMINRQGLDKLPNEYYEGKYYHQTDMFYLAELFNRHMHLNEHANTFSYQNILNKMMEKDKDKRFESFSKAQEAMTKKDFDLLEIDGTDKEIYQVFANKVFHSLSEFIDERKFNNKPSEVLKKLTKVLKENCFENEIQQNNDLVSVFVLGGYKYNKQVNIHTYIVDDFKNWMQGLNISSQQLVVDNLIKKLSAKKVNMREPELPF